MIFLTIPISLLIGDDGKKESRQKLNDYKIGMVYQVLVLSYEQCRRNLDILKDINFGLLICDEVSY
jgi:SNF2 family DNA or RNA helicase